MMILRQHFLAVIILLMADGSVLMQDVTPSSLVVQNKVERVLTSLELLLSYYTVHVGEMNLDGMFGLRIVEGALISIQMDQSSHDVKLNLHLNHFIAKISQALQQQIPLLIKRYPEEYKLLSSLVEKPYIVQYKRRSTLDSLVWKMTVSRKESLKVLDEPQSDACFSELLNGDKCQLSSRCIDLMTMSGMSGYALLHQILYITLASQTACASDLDAKLKASGKTISSYLLLEFCTNSLHEMRNMVQGTSIQPDDADLYFEHLFVCPSVGFYEFLDEHSLNILLSSQDILGCYKDPPLNTPGQRKLLREEQLEDGCMSHKTAVAAAAIVQYLRIFLEEKYDKSLTVKSETVVDDSYLVFLLMFVLFVTFLSLTILFIRWKRHWSFLFGVCGQRC